MPDVSIDNLLIISVIAELAPLLAGALPKCRVLPWSSRSWPASSSGRLVSDPTAKIRVRLCVALLVAFVAFASSAAASASI